MIIYNLNMLKNYVFAGNLNNKNSAKKFSYTSMLKYWNVFSDIPEKSKYFLNLTQGDIADVGISLSKNMLLHVLLSSWLYFPFLLFVLQCNLYLSSILVVTLVRCMFLLCTVCVVVCIAGVPVLTDPWTCRQDDERHAERTQRPPAPASELGPV